MGSAKGLRPHWVRWTIIWNAEFRILPPQPAGPCARARQHDRHEHGGDGRRADNRHGLHGEPAYARSWGHVGEYDWDGASRCTSSWYLLLFFSCARRSLLFRSMLQGVLNQSQNMAVRKRMVDVFCFPPPFDEPRGVESLEASGNGAQFLVFQFCQFRHTDLAGGKPRQQSKPGCFTESREHCRRLLERAGGGSVCGGGGG